MKFYFTYGITDGYPFKGGWTTVIAPTREIACNIFRIFHPDRIKGIMNCSFVYDEQQMARTDLEKVSNWGARCQEIISCKIEQMTPGTVSEIPA